MTPKPENHNFPEPQQRHKEMPPTRSPPTKWKSQVIPIDIDTGEILDQSQIESTEYYITKKTVHTERQGEHNAIRIVQWYCRRNNQICIDLE